MSMSDGKQYTKPIQSVYCHGWKPQQVSVETCSECARLRAENERLREALRGVESWMLAPVASQAQVIAMIRAALAAKGET
jgi:hypothetical protein